MEDSRLLLFIFVINCVVGTVFMRLELQDRVCLCVSQCTGLRVCSGGMCACVCVGEKERQQVMQVIEM